MRSYKIRTENSELIYEEYLRGNIYQNDETGYIIAIPSEYNFLGSIFTNNLFGEKEMIKKPKRNNSKNVLQYLLEMDVLKNFSYGYDNYNQRIFCLGDISDYKEIYREKFSGNNPPFIIYKNKTGIGYIVSYGETFHVYSGIGGPAKIHKLDINTGDNLLEYAISEKFGFGYGVTTFFTIHDDQLFYLGKAGAYYPGENIIVMGNGDIFLEIYDLDYGGEHRIGMNLSHTTPEGNNIFEFKEIKYDISQRYK